MTAAFPPQMAGFLLLAGEVLARGTAAGGAVPSEAPNPLQESLAPFLADLPSALQSRPLTWCPLLCSVLLSSADVPGNLLRDWLKAGVELLEVCAPASMPSRGGPPGCQRSWGGHGGLAWRWLLEGKGVGTHVWMPVIFCTPGLVAGYSMGLMNILPLPPCPLFPSNHSRRRALGPATGARLAGRHALL